MKLALILNGPPGSGKDTIAEEFVKLGFQHFRMKDQLYIDTADVFNVTHEVFKILATNRNTKDVKNILLVRGEEMLSPREALIYTAEKIMKPMSGQGYYGHCVFHSCFESEADYVVISDGGFKEELEPFYNNFNKTIVARLHRDGCTFDNDSRNYIQDVPNLVDVDIIENHPEKAVEYILTTFQLDRHL